MVDGHVLLLNRDGQTIVDTDSRKRDTRKVVGLWGVFGKGQVSMFDGRITHVDDYLKKYNLYP